MIRIIKVGGSLFDLPDLGVRIDRLLVELPPATNVLIAGGGKIADAAAAMQPIHQLTEEATHWLCIKALFATSELLRMLVPASRLTEEPQNIQAAAFPSLWILDTEQILRSPNSHKVVTSLPQNATVTTDSIAAAVAVELGAEELILAKSTNWPTEPSTTRFERLARAASLGLVDAHFPEASALVPKIGWNNLRAQLQAVWLQ